MRIGLVAGSFLPTVGGLEWKVHYLATEYVRHGHDVIVFANRPRRSFKPVAIPVEPEYAVVRVGIPIPGIERFGVACVLYRRAILRAHAQRPFDVLHCHHLGPPTRYGVSVKRVAGVPVVATTCGADVQLMPEIGYGHRLDRRIDRITRQNLREIDVVGSISSAVRADLESMNPTARIVDIPNGVQWDDFQTGPSRLLRERLGIADDAVLVLSVGRNHVKKGYAHGIRAFARISSRFPQARYALVGRETTQLAGLVDELAMGGRVFLVKQAPMTEMPHIYHSADVFFNPSLVEGFAQVNAQALACGLPCVITDAPGNRDAGDHGGALIARSADEASMAEALAQLVGDPEARRRLGEAAHTASRRYSWRYIAEQYLAIFEELAGDGRGAPLK